MKTNDARILLALLPQDDGSEDVPTDPRWHAALRRVAHYQLILRQLMSPETGDAMIRLMERHTDSLNPAWQSPYNSRAYVLETLRKDMTTWRQVLAMEAGLGPGADSDGIDVIVQQMIDEASTEGGPIVRQGNNLLGGDAGPILSGTATSRIVHLLLYHGERGRYLRDDEPCTLFERCDTMLEGTYREVAWLHERVNGSLPTLYAAVRQLTAMGIIEQSDRRAGVKVRLRAPYTWVAAEDRKRWCQLRDQGRLPITRNAGTTSDPIVVAK